MKKLFKNTLKNKEMNNYADSWQPLKMVAFSRLYNIKAVAAGEYRHEMPKGQSLKEYGSGLMENVTINVLDEKMLLAGFANIMGWDQTDLTEEGYLKAVVQNKTGKAAVIKDLIEIRSSGDEDS